MRISHAGFAIAVCLVAAGTTYSAPVEWPTSSGGNGHFYEFVPDRVNWATARDDANSRAFGGMPGYLANVTSAAENDFVKTLIANAPWAAWLGGNDLAVEGDWRWDGGPEAGQAYWAGNFTGGPVNSAYHGFSPDAPNDLNDEDGLGIWGPSGADGLGAYGIWNDFQVSDTHGFLVEYSRIPEPSSLLVVAVMLLVTARYRFQSRSVRE